MSKADEYDAFYTKEPGAWAESPDRDAFAWAALQRLPQPGSVLDIGCGNGHTIAYLQQRWPGTMFVGLDLSSVAVQLARQRGVPGSLFISGELGRNLGGLFDVVLLLGVAEHFEDLLSGLSMAAAYLKNGGVMYLEAPNCLGYPGAHPDEGFRAASIGRGQIEWHLKRSSWEQAIITAGLSIRQALRGPSKFYEFVWLLERGR